MACQRNVAPGAQTMLLANRSAEFELPEFRAPPVSDAGATFGPAAVAGLSHYLDLDQRP